MVIVGYRLPVNLKDDNGETIYWYDDKYLPYLEGQRDAYCTMYIDDSGSSKEIIFGKVITRSDEYSSFEAKEIIMDEVQEAMHKVRQIALDVFKDTCANIANRNLHTYLFTYSS